jgi:RES domain-containing protein
MQVYRLVKARYADDLLDPQGAKRYGGRWNSKGISALYSADSTSLAALELLVHLHRSAILNHYMLATIELPDESVMTLDTRALPQDWRKDPAPPSTQILGDEWLASHQSLALAVPSTIVPQQYNLLINPKHIQFSLLKNAIASEPFLFDSRLL